MAPLLVLPFGAALHFAVHGITRSFFSIFKNYVYII